jgi:RimJ/RimL family protein N-acetyltransferase
MVTLRQPLTLAECLLVREWRNAPDVLPMLRTGYKSVEAQTAFHADVICGDQSQHRYYAVDDQQTFVGIGGLTDLDLVPGQAEITLVLGPHARGHGLGRMAVEALRTEAVRLGLMLMIGECYQEGPCGFWRACLRTWPAGLWWTDDRGSLHWVWHL